jgi:ribonuclease VapC
LIVVDTSALVAIAENEPERNAFLGALRASVGAYLTPINYVETGVVLKQRGIVPGPARLNLWLSELEVELKEDSSLASLALEAYLRFGKGLHPARLNLADCFAYALAKQLDAPLLYKGDDFARTDIRSALQPT